MPFAFILIGLILIITSIRGTSKQFFDSVKQDFTGPNNFLVWIMALFGLGMLGYIKALKPISDGFLTLTLIVMVINNRNGLLGQNGLLEQIQNHQIASGTAGGSNNPSVASSGSDSYIPALGSLSDMATSLTSPVDNILCASGLGQRIGITACGGKQTGNSGGGIPALPTLH